MNPRSFGDDLQFREVVERKQDGCSSRKTSRDLPGTFQISHAGHNPSLTRISGLSLIDFCKASEFELASPQICQPAWSWGSTRKMPRVPS